MTEPELSGRCARCHELTVLERTECKGCNGTGRWPFGCDCPDCAGHGFTEESTPCCGVGLIDEAEACDEAYERGRSEGWGV